VSAADNDVQLQKLWISLQRKAWRVLAIVPATREISSLAAANVLAEVAWRYRGDPTSVLDLREVGLRLVEYQTKEITAQIEQGNSVILALSSVSQNASAISLARFADAAVLLVRYGETSVEAAEQSIAEIGADKFCGTLVVKPGSGATEAPSSARAPAPKKVES